MNQDPDFGAVSARLKVRLSCQYPHLAEVLDIESISEPRLTKVIYAICQNLSLDEEVMDELPLRKLFIAKDHVASSSWI